MGNPFFLDVFIITLRESLEASVIVSVLLSFVKQSFDVPVVNRKAYHRLLWHVWLGVALGFLVCLCIGAAFIAVFYTLGNDIWAQKEDLWEGILALIASIMITFMGLGMLRIEKMKNKWRTKIAEVILEGGLSDEENKGTFSWLKRISPKRLKNMVMNPKTFGRWGRKYSMLLLTFVTVLREGVEAIVFIAGVSLGHPAYSYPLPVTLGLLCGCAVGYGIYLGGLRMPLKWFLVASTCFLYLISAGLFSRSIWYLQMYVFSAQTGGDVGESGSGPGSYNIKQTVWHLDCCNPEMNNGGWGIFNALFGWQNTGTYGSVISYNCYWIFVDLMITALIYEEKTGKLPIVSYFWTRKQVSPKEADAILARAQEQIRHQVNDFEENSPTGLGKVESYSQGSEGPNSPEEKAKNQKAVRTREMRSEITPEDSDSSGVGHH